MMDDAGAPITALPPAGYFLVPNKKVTKEIGIRGASGKCAPLCIPRRLIVSA